MNNVELPEEFRLVLRSKKSRKLAKSSTKSSLEFSEVSLKKSLESNSPETNAKLIEHLQKRIIDNQRMIDKSVFYQQLESALLELEIGQIVCFGIGNFSFLSNSFLQLLALHQLKANLKLGNKSCFVYDPVLTTSEINFLNDLGFEVPTENSECCFKVNNTNTLFFMIHCGTAMYNNVLWSNFNPAQLQHCFILGNSFKEIEQVAEVNNDVAHDSYFIRKLIPYFKEIFLEPEKTSELYLAFTGTSLLKVNLNVLPEESNRFWADELLISRPEYKDYSSIILSQGEPNSDN